MARGKASKAKATPARQGSLGVSRHPHIKKPSQLIGRQIAVPGAELARRRGGGPQLGARAGSGLGGLIKRRARRMPSCTASKSKHTHNVSLMSVFSPHQPRQPTRRAGAASDVETNACFHVVVAWFIHSEPMTSMCGLLPLLPPPRTAQEARDIGAEFLSASVDASS